MTNTKKFGSHDKSLFYAPIPFISIQMYVGDFQLKKIKQSHKLKLTY